MQRLSITLLLTTLLVGLSAAQNATITVFLFGTDPQPLVASVVSANAATTSLTLGCPSGEDASDCGFGPGIDVEITSSSIIQASMTPPGEDFSFSFSCNVNSQATTAVCVTSAGGQSADFPGVTTTTFSGTDVDFLPVTVTAGRELLSATGSAGSTSASPSSGKSTSSGTAASTSQPTTSGSSATGSGSAPKSTSGGSSVMVSMSSLGLSLIVVALVVVV